MAKYLPEMKQLMEKRLNLGLNGNRNVEGTLRGYDQFMNIVLDDCVEVKSDGERKQIGMSVIRGNSILTMETLHRVVSAISQRPPSIQFSTSIYSYLSETLTIPRYDHMSCERALEDEFGLRNLRADWLRRQTGFSATVLSGPISRTDICSITEGTLPWNIIDAHSIQLGTKVLVQVEDVINIANSDPRSADSPRVLQLTLSDGALDFVGIELEPFGGRIALRTVPGTKLVLHASALVRRGRILLTPKDFTVLTGPTENIWGDSYDDKVAEALSAAGLHNPNASSFDSIARNATGTTNRPGNAGFTGLVDMGGIADAVPQTNEEGSDDEEFWAQAMSIADRREAEAVRAEPQASTDNANHTNVRPTVMPEPVSRADEHNRDAPRDVQRHEQRHSSAIPPMPVPNRAIREDEIVVLDEVNDVLEVTQVPEAPMSDSEPAQSEPTAEEVEDVDNQVEDMDINETEDLQAPSLPLSRLEDIGSSNRSRILLIRAYVSKPKGRPKIRYESSRISVFMPFDDGTTVVNLLLRQNILQDLTGIDFHANDNIVRDIVSTQDNYAESPAAHQIRKASRGICGFIQVHDEHGRSSVSKVSAEPPSGFVRFAHFISQTARRVRRV